MIAKRMESLYPSNYRSDLGVTRTPILLLQAPPAPDERRFYQHILALRALKTSAVGASRRTSGAIVTTAK